jgi:hypothetical protein
MEDDDAAQPHIVLKLPFDPPSDPRQLAAQIVEVLTRAGIAAELVDPQRDEGAGEVRSRCKTR